jgi:hypothetical protein
MCGFPPQTGQLARLFTEKKAAAKIQDVVTECSQ